MLSCLCFHVLRFYIPPTSERICDSLKIVLNVTCVCMCVYSGVQLLETTWTAARQAPLSMGYPRQEYWSGLLCPPPGDLPGPRTEPAIFISPEYLLKELAMGPPQFPIQ